MNNRSFPSITLRWLPVWRRNLRVWRKLSGPALIGNFGEPLLYLLALGYGLGGFIGTVNGLPYIVFLASGIVCASAMNTASFEGLYSAYTRMAVQNTWGGMLATPLSIDDIVLGEILWAGTKSLISAVPILLVAAALGVVHDAYVLGVLPVVFIIGVCFGAMALVVTAVAKSYDFFIYYFTLVITPLFLVSGVFFPLDGMPDAVRIGAQLLPLAHAVDVVRPLMTGQPLPSLTLLYLIVPLLYAAGAFWLATVLLRRRLVC